MKIFRNSLVREFAGTAVATFLRAARHHGRNPTGAFSRPRRGRLHHVHRRVCAAGFHLLQLSAGTAVADAVHSGADDVDAQLSRFGNDRVVQLRPEPDALDPAGAVVRRADRDPDRGVEPDAVAVGDHQERGIQKLHGQPRRRVAGDARGVPRVEAERARIFRRKRQRRRKHGRQRVRELDPAPEDRRDGGKTRFSRRRQRRPFSGAAERAALRRRARHDRIQDQRIRALRDAHRNARRQRRRRRRRSRCRRSICCAARTRSTAASWRGVSACRCRRWCWRCWRYRCRSSIRAPGVR